MILYITEVCFRSLSQHLARQLRRVGVDLYELDPGALSRGDVVSLSFNWAGWCDTPIDGRALLHNRAIAHVATPKAPPDQDDVEITYFMSPEVKRAFESILKKESR